MARLLIVVLIAAGCAGSSAGAGAPLAPLAPVAPSSEASASGGSSSPAAATSGAALPFPTEEPPPPELAFPAEPFREETPKAGAPRPLQPPVLQRFKLKPGIDVFLVERHSLPIVSLSLVFEGGAALDPPGKDGLASQCMGLMTDGTERLDKIAFEEALADLASSVFSGASADTLSIGMSALKKNLDATLDLWAESLLHPGLRADEFDRSLKRRIAGLQQMKGVPAAVAGRLAGSIIYGEGHMYGRLATEATYRALKPEDCKPFIADYVKPAGSKLFVVGDVTRAEVEDKLGRRLTDFRGRPKGVPRPRPPAPRKGRVFFVDMPDAPQSVIYLMHEGPKRTAADYKATSVMSGILGEGFSSRINMNIREKHGYAYGARGAFQYTRADSTYRASASVRTDVTKESVVEMLKEIRGMREGDPTIEELSREKQGRILSLPARFATGSEALEAYRELVYYGLPLTYYERYMKEVESVDAAAVKRAAQKHLRPERLQLLVVGDGKSVLPKLEELAASPELGGTREIVMLDADGKPVGRERSERTRLLFRSQMAAPRGTK